jgi:membrane protein DedA with SNARE-associated domain
MASESCINRSQRFFKNRSLPVILVSKLIPGVNTLVPSLAGIAGISPLRYVLFDAIGCLFWVGAGLGAGMLFDSGVLDHLSEMQPALIALLVAMIAVYVPLRLYNKRRQKQRQPDTPTIDIVPTPTELPTPADL